MVPCELVQVKKTMNLTQKLKEIAEISIVNILCSRIS